MSIASRQIKKELNRIIKRKMEGGEIPSIEYIIAMLARYYRKVDVGFPSFSLRKQLYRKPWDIDKYNNNLLETYDDLNNLYEELVDQFTIVLQDFDYHETERQRLMWEIRDLDDDLMNLLLIAEDTEGYLYSVHDNFIDRSKINLTYSTCEVNTNAGIVTLRESRQGIEKINMSHYFDIVNFPILAEEKYTDNIISNKLLAGSKFGYAFSDVNMAWIQNIISKANGKVEVAFIVNLDPNPKEACYISRIEILGHSSNPMWVTPLWSMDNINFKNIPISTGKVNKVVSDSKKTIWNFAELKVKYLKFIITKLQEDETVGISEEPFYRYIYGFKNIEIYKMAYNSASALYSNVFTVTDFTGEALTVDKASIVADYDLEAGTHIDFYLSLGDEDVSDPSQFNWVAVSPLNDPNPREQQIADFRHVAFFNDVPDIQWDSATYNTALETYNGISFYKVYQFPDEPLRDSITLYRGKDNWQVIPKYEVRVTEVYDEEHTFGSGSTVTLTYPDFTPDEGRGLIKGSVKVKSNPGDNPDYIYINKGDYTINYSTGVITRTTTSNISTDTLASANTVYVDYKYDDEESKNTQYVTYIYILNKDGLDINIVPFNDAEIEAENFLTIDTSEGTKDLSAESFFHIPPGWHKVITTAQPRTASDRFYSVNDNQYLYQKVYEQYAYGEKLQEVSWFELKYNTLKSDHSRFCIVDYDGDWNKEIVVNYEPQTSAWASSSDDLLCAGGDTETYVLSYKYIATTTSNIYLKAELSRDDDVSPMVTPTLRGYTIKLGY